MSARRHCLEWTVEWLFNDGTRYLGSSPEKRTIQAAYEFVWKGFQHMKLGISKKRKRESAEGETAPDNTVQHDDDSLPVLQAVHETMAGSDVAEQPDAQVNLETGNTKPDASPPLDTDQQPNPPENSPYPPDPPSPEPTTTADPTSSSNLYFYIHVPHPAHPSSQPTVLPLTPDLTLGDALKGRTVLEFPRIYALRHKPEEVPKGVVIEKEPERKEVMENVGEDKIVVQQEETLGEGLKGERNQPERIKKEKRGGDAVVEKVEGLTTLEALRLKVLSSMGR